jgi:hypothetical protein
MWRVTLVGLALVIPGGNLGAQQYDVTFHGGIHAARLERPERSFGTGPVAMVNASGEAATVGLRLGRWVTRHWGIDAGVEWSRNHSWQGFTTVPPPSFDNQTVFTSVTLRVRPTARAAAISVSGSVGPALVFHRGNGASLLTRQTDIGAVLGAGAEARISSRIGVRLDLQNYLFSSRFAQTYRPPFRGSPVEPAGEQFRHEWVVLAGATLHLGH